MLPRQVTDFCLDILASGYADPNERSIAWNLLHDQRISPWRAAHWAAKAGGALHSSLAEGVRVYRDLLVKEPLMYRGAVNASNIPRPTDPELPGPGDMLVQILDLANATSMAIWTFGKDVAHISALNGLDVSNTDRLIAGLSKRLSGRPAEDQAALLDAFFNAQNFHLQQGGHQGPVWVTLWERWLPRIDLREPETWAKAVGLSKPRQGAG
ncbi:MAG: hypothetical protein ABSB35_18660 [Bryobacteraceae bacterium]